VRKEYTAKLNILFNNQKLTHSVSCLLFLVWWLYVLCLCTTYCVDLIDEGRYNMIVPIAKALGMNVEMKAGEPPYYKEDVIAILCKAIYHSYKTSKVALVDHHTLIDMFYDWYEAESVSRGYCPVNWKWVIVSCLMNLISTSTLFLTHNILYCMISHLSRHRPTRLTLGSVMPKSTPSNLRTLWGKVSLNWLTSILERGLLN